MRSLIDQQFAGQKLFEHLLIVSPNEQVSKRVSDIKAIFHEEYGCKHAINLKPHITLINFLQYEGATYRIVNCFEKFSQTVEPFNIILNGFGHFSTHTIYVNLTTSMPLTKIVSDIQAKFQHLLKSSESLRPKFIKKPHLTIARGMTEEQHQEAWPTWKKENFEDSFRAEKMILIKRELDPKNFSPIGYFKPVQEFSFRRSQREEQLVLAL